MLSARFGSKQDLWFAAMEDTINQLVDRQTRASGDHALDDLERLRRNIVDFIVFSAEHPEVLRIMSVEGATDSERLTFVYERLINPAAERGRRLLDRLAKAGRIRAVPYPAFHYLLTHGGAAPFSHPASAHHLGMADVADPAVVAAHAEVIAEFFIRALVVDK